MKLQKGPGIKKKKKKSFPTYFDDEIFFGGNTN